MDPQAMIDEAERWRDEHLGPGTNWRDWAALFFDDRDRRERGERGEIPDIEYQRLERRWGRSSRERLASTGQQLQAAIEGDMGRKAAIARFEALKTDPAAVSALERLIAREIEAEAGRLSRLKVVV